jgi:preprotein translocase subunit Sec61beta
MPAHASNGIVSIQETEYMQFNLSDPRLIVGIVILVAIIAIVAAIFVYERRRKTAKLRQHYGSEYDRTVLEHGSAHTAEAQLAAREERVHQFKIRDLALIERDHFTNDWQSVQSRFVDHPRGAVIDADELVSSLMQTRGYPMTDFEQRAADISVNYPRVVENYRAAHATALRLASSDVTTEDMRTAMLQYRALFDELLQVHNHQEAAA